MRLILFFMKKYYLKKISIGEMTVKEVAQLYSTSENYVENAVKEYQDRKNPFRKISSQTWQGISQLIISLASVIIVLLTLFEMQAERNATYMPTISVRLDESNIIYYWNEKKIFVDDILIDDESDIPRYTEDFAMNLVLQDIGVGLARDVSLDYLYSENKACLEKAYNEIRKIAFETGNELTDSISNSLLRDLAFLSEFDEYDLKNIPADINMSTYVKMPSLYIELCGLAAAYNCDIPSIRFAIEYKDVQGKNYRKTFEIEAYISHLDYHQDGSGCGAVAMRLIDGKLEHSSFIEIFFKWCCIIIVTITVVIILIIILAIAFEIRRRRNNSVINASCPIKSTSNKDILQNDNNKTVTNGENPVQETEGSKNT